ncbi:hypothetical protein BGX28_005030 [Mortierella sp. GBA30]|nr:hypothetical protein BGX28_005030 [Mortierella sp. GBA30]
MTAPQYFPTSGSIAIINAKDHHRSSSHPQLPKELCNTPVNRVTSKDDEALILSSVEAKVGLDAEMIEVDHHTTIASSFSTEDNEMKDRASLSEECLASTSVPTTTTFPQTERSTHSPTDVDILQEAPDPIIDLIRRTSQPPITTPITSATTTLVTTAEFLKTPSTRSNSPSASMSYNDATTYFDDMVNGSESRALGESILTPSSVNSLPELYHDFFDNHPEICYCDSDQSTSDAEMMDLDDEDVPGMIRARAIVEMMRQATSATAIQVPLIADRPKLETIDTINLMNQQHQHQQQPQQSHPNGGGPGGLVGTTSISPTTTTGVNLGQHNHTNGHHHDSNPSCNTANNNNTVNNNDNENNNPNNTNNNKNNSSNGNTRSDDTGSGSSPDQNQQNQAPQRRKKASRAALDL